MKDTTTMTLEEKDAYIFAERQSKIFPLGRFYWIECLLADIRTFLDGIEHYLQSKPSGKGGGNLSVPILISTALELIAALYVGKTEYMNKQSYNATENVKQFIIHFFPEHYNQFPLLLWDGVRNGIIHMFSPKAFEYENEIIRFQFSVEDKRAASFTTKEENTIFVRINDFELYDIFKKAIENYRQQLQTDEELQNRFIQAWESIETYIRPIDISDKDKLSETKWLVAETKSQNHLILWKDRPNGDITESQLTRLTPEIGTTGKGTTTVNASIANTTLV